MAELSIDPDYLRMLIGTKISSLAGKDDVHWRRLGSGLGPIGGFASALGLARHEQVTG